jgi:hypothetical protein
MVDLDDCQAIDGQSQQQLSVAQAVCRICEALIA